MAAVRGGAARGEVESGRGDVDGARRSVVPDAAGRSLWLAAVWTGVGAAVVCVTLAIVAVAICWLPVSGAHGHPTSAVRAGLLTFLASLHGGVTVDGTSTQFVPLGMTLVVVLTAWRAGAGLGDAAASLDERDPARLAIAAALQAASFTCAALVAVPFGHLGSSSAPLLGVAGAGLLLFAAVGGSSFIRTSALREWCSARQPAFVAPAARAAGVAVLVYLGAGAVLVAGSLVVHASRVEALSRQVGGGWGSVPIVLLGLLAAPNAVIAGSSYLSGAGFTVGGTSVGVLSTSHGILPAFPILGAVPTGHGATWYVWVMVGATPMLAGLCVAQMAARNAGWGARMREVATAAALAGVAWSVLAWQGGGGIGSGRLAVIGASWWQVGGMVLGEVAVTAGVTLAVRAAWAAVRGGGATGGTVVAWLARADTEVLPSAGERIPPKGSPGRKADEAGKLAG
jgi:hypothetical protein